MRPALLAAVLLVPSAAVCAPQKAKAPKKAEVLKSSAAAQGLPLLAPPTGPITVELVVQRFEEFDQKVATLSADFRQVVRWDESGVQQAVEGSLQYKKPDRLRIEHRLPERQTIVADGTWLWVWRRDNNQVVQSKLEDWKKSEPVAQSLLDFGNYAKLVKTYAVAIATVSAPAADGQRSFEIALRPKENPSQFTLTMKMSTADFFPSQTELKVGGVLVRSLFTGIRYNPPLENGLFEFTPPADADVFQNFKPPHVQRE